MPSNKKNAITKYEKTNKILEIVKTYKRMNLNNKAIIDAVNFHTGRTLSESQLAELVEMAKKEVREQQIEVNKHMEHMVTIGFYVDSMNDHEQLVTVQQILYSEILSEQNKPSDKKSMNKIMSMSNTLKNIIAAKDNIMTNIGFLSKIREMHERINNQEENDVGPAIELNSDGGGNNKDIKKANIMIKDQKTDVNKLIDDVIDKKELERNRVA